MKSIEIKAPAKINIGLYIVEKREDGFHNLETFFYPIRDLYDLLIIKKSNKFTFHCNWDELNTDSNLIIKTVKLLEEKVSKQFNVDIRLQKKIPFGGGLGGGSSDAAAVLISLNEMFKLNLSFDQLKIIALELGSDVPFFLYAKPAIGKSRGEVLRIIDFEIKKPILLVNPGINVSTKEAFENITPHKPDIDLDNLFLEEKQSFFHLQKLLKNDFEDYVFKKHMEIKELKEIMLLEGAELSLMSGSGSTVFGIFPDKKSAEDCAVNISNDYFKFVSLPPEY
jgi:4-diphosphocytidyl-2-C-methyl-D-erythritol kinase